MWLTAQWAEGAYHRASGHHDGQWNTKLRTIHRAHHADPIDASDDEYFCMVAAMTVLVTIALVVRPKCRAARGVLDAGMLVALAFPYVSWVLHAEYHNPKTPLQQCEWFRTLRQRHRVHHTSGGTVNFGISSALYDITAGTLRA